MPIKKKSEMSDRDDVKICPYCANEVKVGAKKCKYCKESLIEEKEFNNEVLEAKQENNKTKRIWGRILALSIPIVAITWLIISIIFYIIGASTGGGSELMLTIKKSINWILGILCFLSFFFTIRGIIILSRSSSKSNGLIQDGDDIDSENVKSSMKIGKITKGFMLGYIIRTIIVFILAFIGESVPEGLEILLNVIFTVGAIVSQIVWGLKTYKGLQLANIKGLTFPKGWGWLVFGWFCPIACLYMPYQIIRDIVNAYKIKTGRIIKKSFFGTIVSRWWGIYLIGGIIGSVLLREAGDGEIGLTLISYIFDILEYVLFITIVTRTEKMQKEYLG